MSDDEEEHGASACYYSRTGRDLLDPTLECLCGFVTRGARSWEEAGAELDEHLTEAEGD